MFILSHGRRNLARQIALATLLSTMAAPLTHASAAMPHPRAAHHQVWPEFNPQPDPPGRSRGSVHPAFNPQPDPPGRSHRSVRPAFNPQPDPPGRSVHPTFNPQPDPPGRSRGSVHPSKAAASATGMN